MHDVDTIVALSTPPGEAALAVVRVSGPDAARIGSDATGQGGVCLPPRVAKLVSYVDRNDTVLDECLITFFPKNRSYTGEDLIELSLHGNPFIVQRVLEDLVERGCRHAEPGEFTRRAFQNGQLDLSQAEAVADLIHARSERSHRAAQRQLGGAIGQEMSRLTEQVLAIVAHLEAYIDFPEEDLPDEDNDGPIRDLSALCKQLDALIATQKYSALLRDGVKVAIIGEPNVGKSTLINALVGEDRSIVTDIAGTTRDYISARAMIGSWEVELIDTAGLRETTDQVEQIGIERTRAVIKGADLYLIVADVSGVAPVFDPEVACQFQRSNALVILNKVDLLPSGQIQQASSQWDDFLAGIERLPVSLHDLGSVREVRVQLEALLDSLDSTEVSDGVVINARHGSSLKHARQSVASAHRRLLDGELPELVSVELREAIAAFGEVVGNIDNERMLDTLFQNFCIGK